VEVLHTRGENTAASYNDAINHATGEAIMILHSGDTLAPETLQQCVDLLSSDPLLHGVYTDCNATFPGKAQPRLPKEYALLHQTPPLPYCTMFKRALWTTLGGFRTNVEGLEAEDFWAGCSHLPLTAWHHLPRPLVTLHNTPWADRRREHVASNLVPLQNRLVLNNPHLPRLSKVAAALMSMNRHLHGVPGSVAQGHRPLVSVIIPTFNRPNLLRRAIITVLDQTLNDLEIIVINDGAIDVENVITELNVRNNITYLRHPHNKGLPAARNTGIRQARGKYIAYLDDDDCYFPEHLETLVNHLETTSAKVAYTDAQRVTIETVHERDTITKCDIPFSFNFALSYLLTSNYIPVLCIAHERACLDTTGLLDESLTTHEDWELNIRLGLQFGMSHIAKVTCSYTARRDGTNMTSSLTIDFLRTSLYIHHKYSPITSRFPEVISLQQKVVRKLKESLQQLSTTSIETIIDTWEQGKTFQALHMARETLRSNQNPDILAFTAKMLWDLGHAEQSNSLLHRLYNEDIETIEDPIQFADILNHCGKFAETIHYITTLNKPFNQAERVHLGQLQQRAESSLRQPPDPPDPSDLPAHPEDSST